jgi:hypothetical protein
MNDGTLPTVVHSPCQIPIAAPSARVTTIVSGTLRPMFVLRYAAARAEKATVEPGERSMLPVTMISTLPTARTAVMDPSTPRFARFRGLRKRPLVSTWNTMKTATITMIRPLVRSAPVPFRHGRGRGRGVVRSARRDDVPRMVSRTSCRLVMIASIPR